MNLGTEFWRLIKYILYLWIVIHALAHTCVWLYIDYIPTKLLWSVVLNIVFAALSLRHKSVPEVLNRTSLVYTETRSRPPQNYSLGVSRSFFAWLPPTNSGPTFSESIFHSYASYSNSFINTSVRHIAHVYIIILIHILGLNNNGPNNTLNVPWKRARIV